MAGHMWVENNLYNRTMEAAREAARQKQEADRKVRAERERLRRLEKERQAAAARNEAQLQQQFREEADRLIAGIDGVSYEMHAALRQYIAQNHREMDSLREAVRSVEQQAQQLDGRIDTLEDSVAQRFRQLAEALEQEQARARLYVNQFQELLRQINALHPDKLKPELVEQEYTPVSGFLEADMATGDYQAAIALAQTKLPGAVALQSLLEELNIRFRLLREEMQQLRALLQDRITQLRDAEANTREIPTDGGAYTYDGQIAFWSNELFLTVLENYEAVMRRYEAAEEAMDLETMARTAEQLQQVDSQLTECREAALEEFRLCVMVQELVDAIHGAMTEDGAWELGASGFAQEDPRRPYRMVFGDGDGHTAAFVVLPNREVSDRGELGEVQFLLGISEADGNMHRRQIIRSSIIARLQGRGIRVGAHNIDPNYGLGQDREAFLQEATRQGDDIKENRMELLRQQLQLTDETGGD